MSHKVSKILPILLLVAGILTAPVQAQKIGYTNQQALLNNMPEMQEVQKKMQKAAKQQQRQMRRKQQKLQKRLKQYRQQRSLLDSTARRQRERKLRQRQRELQQSSRKRQQRLRQRRRKLMQPLLKNLQSAINLVANRRDIDMVVRSQALLFVKQNSDQVVNITSDVASELGITLSQNPGTPSPSVNPSTPSPSGGGSGGR